MIGRRMFIGLLPALTAALARPRSRRRRPRVETWCHLDGRPVSPMLAEMNRVTMAEMAPAVRDELLRTEPFMRALRRVG